MREHLGGQPIGRHVVVGQRIAYAGPDRHPPVDRARVDNDDGPCRRRQRDEAREAAEKIEHEIPAEFRGIGVRIEDNVLITVDGSRNLTAGVPTGPDEIQALCVEASSLPRL